MSGTTKNERCDPNAVELGPRAAFGAMMCLFAFGALGYLIAGVTGASAQSPDAYTGLPSEHAFQEKGAIE